MSMAYLCYALQDWSVGGMAVLRPLSSSSHASLPGFNLIYFGFKLDDAELTNLKYSILLMFLETSLEQEVR